MSLTFNEERHEYQWHGRVVPSVTQCLKSLTDYSFIKPEVLAKAQEEGKAVHKMVELDVKGDLDEDALPEWMSGHLKAWRFFLRDTQFKALRVEHRGYSEAYGFAGTLDLEGRILDMPWLFDVKRSFYAGAAIGLQLSGYEVLLDQSLRYNRAALQLKADGTYRMMEFNDRSDRSVFLAAVTMHKWRIKHGRT